MNAPKNTPDGTNPFECGETSAIGRALAFAGFGSVESIASKDEIERSRPFTNSEQVETPTQNTSRSQQTQTAQTKPDEQSKPIASIPTFNGLRKVAVKYLDEMTFNAVLKDFNRDHRILTDREYTPEEIVKLRDILTPMINEAKQAQAS